MNRFFAIILIATVAALGSGALRHVHEATHSHHDAAAKHDHEHEAPPATPHHDSTNCEIHAKLNTPLFAGAYVPLLIALGLAVTFLSRFKPAFVSRFFGLRLDCRGPPVC